jgi:protease PrsW
MPLTPAFSSSHPGQTAQPHPLLTRGALLCGALSLGLMAGDLGLGAFGLGFVLAVVPVPVYVMLALWLDRFEPEPARTLVQTFAWGATVAVFVALLVNGLADALLRSLAGPDTGELLGMVLMAPVVEEAAKCFALYILFRELKDEFDGVVDGVVYAAMVGLGFAMMENVQYYGAAIAEGGGRSAATFFLRGLVSPFAHPLFTAMFGIGLGVVRERHGEGGRWGPPLAGLLGAIGLHSLWNLAASMEGWFFAAYLLVMFPVFLGVLILIYLSLRRESRVVREHLAFLLEAGLLTGRELEDLCHVRVRLGQSARAWLRGGVAEWRLRRELHRITSELAFHRWRVGRGLSLGEERDAARETAYLHQLTEVCARLRAPGPGGGGGGGGGRGGGGGGGGGGGLPCPRRSPAAAGFSRRGARGPGGARAAGAPRGTPAR